MDDSEPGPAPDHLFSDRLAANRGGSAYGTWRRIATADAAPLHFGFPFPDAFPTDRLQEAVAGLLEAEGGQSLQYGGGEYDDALVRFLADRERERGIEHAEDGLVVVNGATHALDLVCRAFLDPGDPVLVEAPTFMGALSVIRDQGAALLTAPLDGDGLDVDALASTLEERRAAGAPIPKLVYTIPNFQNPAGVTLTADRRRRLLDLAAEYDFVVVSDDAYGELRYEGDPVEPLAAMDGHERVVRLGTLSKTVAPGIRTGWLVAAPAIADEIMRIDAGGSHSFVRGVLGYYCEAGHYEPVLSDLREEYAERRDHLLAALDAHMPADADWTEPAGGFFLWVTLPDGVDADAMLDDALEAGVSYLPGSMFYPDDRGGEHLRLSFSHATPDQLDEGVRVLAEQVEAARE